MVDVLAAFRPKTATRSLSLEEYFSLFTGDYSYSPIQTLTPGKETVGQGFAGYAADAYAGSGIVFALELVRMQVFSEARIAYRTMTDGRPGRLFQSPGLAPIVQPAPGQTTGSFLARAVLDVDLAGNNFALRGSRSRLTRLRPDWVTIVIGGEPDDPEGDVVGYLYHPGGDTSKQPISYTADEVAHWAPIPDPLASYRGMSWLTPVAREIATDKQATQHKQKFLENGATPNMIIKHQINDTETLKKWVALFNETHVGTANAYKTLHLAAGADVTVVGKDFQQLDFKAVQGAGETRIAAASGVGAVMAQFSEGMQGSSLNAGNYAAARRRVADAVFRPLWRSFCGSYAHILPEVDGAELWYDERDIAFLREDEKDAAEIQFRRASTIRTLVDSGWEADSVKNAVDNDDISLLKHTGLFSVQLQKPGAVPTANTVAPDASDPDAV